MKIERPGKGIYDEVFDETHQVRPASRALERWLLESDDQLIADKRREADVLFQRLGITFNAYGEEQGAAALRILAGHARCGSGADRGRAKGCRRREEQRSHGELRRRRHDMRD